MSERRQVQIRLHPDGAITGETLGMKGASCLSALTLLEALLDATVADSAFTAEFFEEETVQDQVFVPAEEEVSSRGA